MNTKVKTISGETIENRPGFRARAVMSTVNSVIAKGSLPAKERAAAMRLLYKGMKDGVRQFSGDVSGETQTRFFMPVNGPVTPYTFKGGATHDNEFYVAGVCLKRFLEAICETGKPVEALTHGDLEQATSKSYRRTKLKSKNDIGLEIY